MKNIKYIINYKIAGLLLILMAIFYSCDTNEGAEELFDDSVTTRYNDQEAELRDLLKSSPEGWRTTYFTDNTQLGGYTFIFKFEDDKNVKMSSDFDGNFDVKTSEYDVIIGSTTKLSFVTKNEIHKLSDSNNSPDATLRGKGYKGDFEFLYYGKDGDDLIFRTNRDFIELRFTKAVKEDWGKLEDSKEMRNNLVSNATTSVFKLLVVSDGTKETRYNFNYNEARLYANPSYIDALGNENELGFGIAATPTGLLVDPAIEIDGATFVEFTYDETKKQFISNSGSQTAAIGFFDEPAFITSDVQNIGTPKSENFRYFLSWGVNSLTSSGFNSLIEDINTAVALYGFEFRGLQFSSVPRTDGTVRVWVNLSGNWLSYSYTSEIKEGKLFLTYVEPANGNGVTLEDAVRPLLNFFGSTKGLYYTEEGSFKTNTNRYSNLSGTLTSAESPNLRVYGLW